MTAANWVLARANCTAAHYFKELVKTIKKDIAHFNRLDVVKKREKGFKVVELSDTIEIRPARLVHSYRGHVEWQAEEGQNLDFVSIRYSDSSINAERNQCCSIEIKLIWNIETLSCDLVEQEKPRSLDYISQTILGEFLFTDL